MNDEPRIQHIKVQHTQDDPEGKPVQVKATIYGAFGIVSKGQWAHLYHVPTGLWLCSLAEQSHAVSCAQALGALPLDWSFNDPEPFRTSQHFREALELVREFERQDGWMDRGDGWKSHPRYHGLALRNKKYHLFGSEREQFGARCNDGQTLKDSHEIESKATIRAMVLEVKQRGALEELTFRREFFIIHTILEHADIRAHVRAETITIEQVCHWLDEAITHALQQSGQEPRVE